MSQLKQSQHLQIPFEEIESGTKNFQNCIGKGGFGTVYKGQLPIHGKPTTVAVKRLNEQFGQGLKEFLTEIQLLTGQTHPNLISLVGYCDEGKEKVIVYEYAERGSLDQYLRRSSSTSHLSWLEKLKICVGAARGLDYLHNHVGQHQTIIHRDIKSSNILIDENWVAKISDLGLSKLSLSGLNRSTVISHACGTPGYIEPEYMYTGIVKKESDIYSFGMVLFEVLCGRLCTTRDDDGFLLSGLLAKDYYERSKLDEIVDPRLKEQMNPNSMNKFSTIAYKCLHYDRGQRPSMDRVLKELEESLEIQLSYTWKASNASEEPYKSSGELGAHISKESATESSEPPVIVSLEEQNQLHISPKITNPNELAYSSGITMQTQQNNEINVAISLGMLQEVTESLLDMDHEVVKLILDIKKHKWKNLQLSELVEEYFEDSYKTFDFCTALENCLKRAREIRQLIFAALNHLEEKKYKKTLEDFQNLKVIGDAFSDEFVKVFDVMYGFVYRRQKVLVDRLQQNKQKLNHKLKHIEIRRKVSNVVFVITFAAALIFCLVASAMAAPAVARVTPAAAAIPLAGIGICMKSILENYRNATKKETKVISAMQLGGFVGITDLDKVKVLGDIVEMDVKCLINTAEFALSEIGDDDEEVVMKFIIDDMKKSLESFVYNMERLETQAGIYVNQTRRTRTVIMQRIAKR